MAKGPATEAMRDNPIQFAIVREDARIERALVERHRPERVMLIASGGCTALTLRALYPQLNLTLVDPNQAQLALVDRKLDALAGPVDGARWARFNVGHDDPAGLSQSGNFESLFRGLRRFVEALVIPADEIRLLFEPTGDRVGVARRMFASRYWPAAFEMFFCAALLEAMFGPEATQYAPRGSYPGYFRRVFERGLLRQDAPQNPFLHHVFLGQYVADPQRLPFFLTAPGPQNGFDYRLGLMQTVDDFHRFHLVSLSNILDWMDPTEVKALIEKLSADLLPGAVVVYRQLNNDRDLEALFGPDFVFDERLAARLHADDRSLFYSSLHVGTKQ
jgi:S-adenosylmethionine-diacylglycerol 3-amino-3-carboxypropyl transferase